MSIVSMSVEWQVLEYALIMARASVFEIAEKPGNFNGGIG